MPSELDRAPGP